MKIEFTAVSPVPTADLDRYAENAGRLGLPEIGDAQPVDSSLAIVGGGPSIVDHEDELKAWDGEIWAINGAFYWCRQRGIEASFYTVDSMPDESDLCDGAEHAILTDTVHPDVFEVLKGAHVELARLRSGDALPYGPTSACTAPAIAARRGHSEITFFGCESSFGEKTHAYQNIDTTLLDVDCGGAIFETSPQMMMQAEYLGTLIRGLPGYLKERSGGLLRAYVEHGEIDVLRGSREFVERLIDAQAEEAA